MQCRQEPPRRDRTLGRALLLAQAWQAHLLALAVLEPGGPGDLQASRQRAERGRVHSCAGLYPRSGRCGRARRIRMPARHLGVWAAEAD